jgi:hypothetical protein
MIRYLRKRCQRLGFARLHEQGQLSERCHDRPGLADERRVDHLAVEAASSLSSKIPIVD